MHGVVTGIVLFLLLALPQVWTFEVRRGEAVCIQAQILAVASTQPEQIHEVEVSLAEPVRESLEPNPAFIPVVRMGEFDPVEEPPQQRPPESPANVLAPTKVPPRQPQAREMPTTAVAQKLPERQVAAEIRISESKVTVAAAAPEIAGAQVDEMPRKLANNREPYYPLAALQAGIEGRVVLRVQISAAGRAAKILVETSSGLASFDESAIAAVRDWQFSPAKRRGLAVMHEVLVPVRFRIRRG